MYNFKGLIVKKCLVITISVMFLVSVSFSSSPARAGERSSVEKDLKIEFVKSELWVNGVNQAKKNSNYIPASKEGNTLYFPEELELALRLIAD